MIKLKSILIFLMMSFALLGVARAHWNEGDPYKMHFPQFPDPEGWDVNATNTGVADDWMCSESGWVKDIHFWGSWKGDIVYPINSFIINIYADVPKNPQDPSSYSMPGQLMKHIVVTNFTYRLAGTSLQGWLDPVIGQILFFNHFNYYQYNIVLTKTADWFYQVEGTIYWLEIIANVASPTTALCCTANYDRKFKNNRVTLFRV